MGNKQKSLRHVAIIMDGNGRWAERHQLGHLDGHREGSKAVRRTIEAASRFGLQYLTLYAFSTENWKRPKEEVNGLMNLLREFIDENLDSIHEKGICIKTIGRLSKIPFLTRKKLLHAIEKTKDNDKGTVILALNYGGRSEIVDAAKKLAKDAIKRKIHVDDIEEQLFSEYLYDPSIPDPELMIRTSGEYRLSNFLLWQLAYAELYVSNVLWPDFDEHEFALAIEAYQKRDRRFGGRKG